MKLSDSLLCVVATSTLGLPQLRLPCYNLQFALEFYLATDKKDENANHELHADENKIPVMSCKSAPKKASLLRSSKSASKHIAMAEQ